jgi:hypothetical protein
MDRFTRKLVSLLSIASVVFAQLSVAAYACPMQFMGLDVVTDEVVESTAVIPDSVSPLLCQKYGEVGQQNVNDTAPPMAVQQLDFVRVIPIALDSPAPLAAGNFAPALHHATAPPLPIRNCCFRI